MAGNIEILGVNKTDIPPTDELKHFQTVNIDAEIIVKDILKDIFDTAVRKSEEQILAEKNYTEISDTNTGDLIDLTRNYKQEFKTILQNLKCQTYKTQPTNNSTLEDQIQKVIDEIKSLETSVRLNIEEGRGDVTMNNNNQVNFKSEVSDLLNPNDKIILDDDDGAEEEVVLQVINLEQDSEVSSFNAFPSEEDLEDVSLTAEETTFNAGDRPQSALISPRLPTTLPSAGETAVPNPVPNPEPEGKLGKREEGERKKKSFGRRIWHFIRKGSGTTSNHSVTKKKDNNM